MIRKEDLILMPSNIAPFSHWITPEIEERRFDTRFFLAKVNAKQLASHDGFELTESFWVKPIDLFRPCPDKEIYDDRCDLCFPDSVSEEHLMWINENRISRYYQCDLYNRYPWTQLGYTYDWNPSNKKNIGLSEFIIYTDRTIYLESVKTISDYLK